MYVTVHHQIRDPKQWEQSTQHIMASMEQGRLPRGLKGLMYLPSTDGRQADCLWEADKLEDLKSFLDGETGQAAKNEYVPVNDRAAVGLPDHEVPPTRQALRTEEAMHLGV